MSMSGRSVDQMRRTPDARANSAAAAVRAVLAADDQHHVGLGGELPHGLLAVLRGITDVVPRGTDDLRKPAPQIAR